jgi:hypothetical protein
LSNLSQHPQQLKGYVEGPLESSKHAALRGDYYAGLQAIKGLGYEVEDFIHHFPCFVGHLTLARFLSLYECYQRTLGVAGHVAEVGVYKGAVSIFLAKLTRIFEPQSLTQVHGFDWFRGNQPGPQDTDMPEGAYCEPYERVARLVQAQGLSNILKIHQLDVANEIQRFLDERPHLQFKLVFLDCGVHQVVRAAIPAFWSRLTPGGMLVFDQYNFEAAPGETLAVREFLPDQHVRTFPYGWMPTAYIQKGG